MGASLLALALLFGASDLPRQAAVAFGGAGALALLFRSVVRVDARRERARIWWTLLGAPLVPLRSIPLADVRAVRIDQVADGKRTRFAVGLQAGDARAIWRGRDLLRARRFAERVAHGLSLPLHDDSTGRFRAREPDELDLSLGERLRRAGPPPGLPVPPPGSPLQLRDGAESVIRFPGQPVSPLVAIVLLGAPAFSIVVFWLLSTPRTVALLLPIPVFIEAGFVWALASALRPKLVVVGPGGVEVRRLGSRKRIAFADLEELVHARDGLHLLSDEAHVVIPHGWMEDERGSSRFDVGGVAKFVAEVIEHAAWHQAAAAAPAAVAPDPPAGSGAPHWSPVASGPTPARPVATAPRRRRRSPDRTLLQLGAFFLIVGLGGTGGAGYWASSVHDFVKRATVTSGTVVELQRARGYRASVYHPVVRFQLPSGQPATFREATGSNPPPYEVGERVEVRYDPTRPADARAGSVRNLWAFPVLAGGMAFVFGFVGIAMLRWYRKEAREAAGLVRGNVPPGSGMSARREPPATRGRKR